MVSIFRHGINKVNIGPIAKASFEETTEMFLHAARHGELDELRGVSSNIMCGQEGYFGTSAFQTYIDNDLMVKLQKERNHKTYNLGKEMNEKNIEKIMDNLMNDDESNTCVLLIILRNKMYWCYQQLRMKL